MKLIYIALLALLFSSCTTVKTQTSSLVAEAKTNKQFGTEIAKTESGHEFNTYASTTVAGARRTTDYLTAAATTTADDRTAAGARFAV